MRANVLADRGAATAAAAGRFRLAHAAERQRADSCETSGSQTGSAQEGAAIETAVRLTAERRARLPRRTWRSVLLISTASLPQLG